MEHFIRSQVCESSITDLEPRKPQVVSSNWCLAIKDFRNTLQSIPAHYYWNNTFKNTSNVPSMENRGLSSLQEWFRDRHLCTVSRQEFVDEFDPENFTTFRSRKDQYDQWVSYSRVIWMKQHADCTGWGKSRHDSRLQKRRQVKQPALVGRLIFSLLVSALIHLPFFAGQTMNLQV